MIRDDWSILNETSGKDDRQVENTMKHSALFRTLFQVLLEASEKGKEFKLYTPEMILDMPAMPDYIQQRFGESEVAGIRKDLEKEQEKLKRFVEKARLGEHFGGLLTEAETAVRETMDVEALEDTAL